MNQRRNLSFNMFVAEFEHALLDLLYFGIIFIITSILIYRVTHCFSIRKKIAFIVLQIFY